MVSERNMRHSLVRWSASEKGKHMVVRKGGEVVSRVDALSGQLQSAPALTKPPPTVV